MHPQRIYIGHYRGDAYPHPARMHILTQLAKWTVYCMEDMEHATSFNPLHCSRLAADLDAKRVCSQAWQVPKRSLTVHAAAAKAGQLCTFQYPKSGHLQELSKVTKHGILPPTWQEICRGKLKLQLALSCVPTPARWFYCCAHGRSGLPAGAWPGSSSMLQQAT